MRELDIPDEDENESVELEPIEYYGNKHVQPGIREILEKFSNLK